MERKSETELTRMLQDAASKVEVGAKYAHYKMPDHLYKVQELVIWTGTDEVAVIYKALYGEHITFARSLAEWLESVTSQGKEVQRFTKLT